MSDDLVLQEYNYLQSTHPDSTVKAQNPAARKKALQKALTKSLGDQFMISVANINILADSINTTLERTRNRPEWAFGCRTGSCRISIYYPVSRILPDQNRCFEGKI